MWSNKHLTPAERQIRIRKITVEHDRYLEAVEGLAGFHYPVHGGVPSVGTLSAMFGDSRAGKTYAVTRYARRFEPTVGEGGLVMPVLHVDMPMEGAGGARAILEAVGDALKVPFSLRMTNPALITTILSALVDRRVELLMLDEFEQVFRENDRRLIGFARALLRKILDLGTLSVVCIGLEPTYGLLRQDSQLLGRGGLPFLELRPYDWGTAEEQRAFQLLCDNFDEHLPFNEKSRLGSKNVASRLFWASSGHVGHLKVLLEAAANHAINDEADCIELAHFARVYEQRRAPSSGPFNPFTHDIALAPSTREKAALKQGGTREKFGKGKAQSITEGDHELA